MGPKVPKSSARRFPRDCASRGAAVRTLFFRVKRECGLIVPPATALYGMRSGTLFSRKAIPDLVPMAKKRAEAESESGGDGLLANPRIVARRRYQPFGRRHRNRSGGFCCFSPSKSREKSFPELYAESSRGFRKVAVFTNFFFLYFWGQKYQKPPHVVFRGSARAAALHGARKIRPMRYPVTGAPQPAPSFSASNESADLLCRQRRHYMACAPHSFYPQGDPRLGSDGGKADGGLKARAAGTVCLQTRE